MEGSEGKVEEEESREMIVMLKLEVARRALRISEPMVPLALGGGLVGCVGGAIERDGKIAYSYEGDVLDVVVFGHCRCGDLLSWLDVKCRVLYSFLFWWEESL
jgi:hypothetical protein